MTFGSTELMSEYPLKHVCSDTSVPPKNFRCNSPEKSSKEQALHRRHGVRREDTLKNAPEGAANQFSEGRMGGQGWNED
jgi:hypothetical protein